MPIDYNKNNPEDLGTDVAAAILPVADGAGVHEDEINRPLEVLRERTEEAKRVVNESEVIQGMDRNLLPVSEGAVKWYGPATNDILLDTTPGTDANIGRIDGTLRLISLMYPEKFCKITATALTALFNTDSPAGQQMQKLLKGDTLYVDLGQEVDPFSVRNGFIGTEISEQDIKKTPFYNWFYSATIDPDDIDVGFWIKITNKIPGSLPRQFQITAKIQYDFDEDGILEDILVVDPTHPFLEPTDDDITWEIFEEEALITSVDSGTDGVVLSQAYYRQFSIPICHVDDYSGDLILTDGTRIPQPDPIDGTVYTSLKTGSAINDDYYTPTTELADTYLNADAEDIAEAKITFRDMVDDANPNVAVNFDRDPVERPVNAGNVFGIGLELFPVGDPPTEWISWFTFGFGDPITTKIIQVTTDDVNDPAGKIDVYVNADVEITGHGAGTDALKVSVGDIHAEANVIVDGDLTVGDDATITDKLTVSGEQQFTLSGAGKKLKVTANAVDVLEVQYDATCILRGKFDAGQENSANKFVIKGKNGGVNTDVFNVEYDAGPQDTEVNVYNLRAFETAYFAGINATGNVQFEATFNVLGVTSVKGFTSSLVLSEDSFSITNETIGEIVNIPSTLTTIRLGLDTTILGTKKLGFNGYAQGQYLDETIVTSLTNKTFSHLHQHARYILFNLDLGTPFNFNVAALPTFISPSTISIVTWDLFSNSAYFEAVPAFYSVMIEMEFSVLAAAGIIIIPEFRMSSFRTNLSTAAFGEYVSLGAEQIANDAVANQIFTKRIQALLPTNNARQDTLRYGFVAEDVSGGSYNINDIIGVKMVLTGWVM